jgi:hypothetical protein
MKKHTPRYLEKYNRNYYRDRITQHVFFPLYTPLFNNLDYRNAVVRTSSSLGDVLVNYRQVIYSLFKPDEPNARN